MCLTLIQNKEYSNFQASLRKIKFYYKRLISREGLIKEEKQL